MMDFDNILSIASQNQGLSGAQKRYSLQAGPPKKDPRSKGVNPAAVQALLKKQQKDAKKIELEKKKQKVDLLAKRVELKSDRKARAMASRTKDNFKGYNGIPVVEVPTKRRSKNSTEDEEGNTERFKNYSVDPEDDEDNYEYEQSDSEPEPEPVPVPVRTSSGGSKPSSKKPSGPSKPAMNFADLLKLAEQKQFEPVELKPKVQRKEERLRTADEIRELEMERKAKRPKTERERDHKSQTISGSGRKNTAEKELKNCKPQKNSERPSQPSGTGKKPHHTPMSDREHSSKPSVGDRERDRPKTSHGDRERSKTNMSGSSGAINKVHSKATPSQVSSKQGGPKSTTSHKSSISSDLTFKKESSSSLQSRHAGIPGSRPPNMSVMGQKSQQSRPIQGSSQKQGPTVSGHKSLKGEPQRSGSNSNVKSNGNPAVRPSIGGPPKAGNRSQARPGGAPQAKVGGVPQAKVGGVPQGRLQGQPGGSGVRPPGLGPSQARNGGPIPGRPTGSLGSGPGRPQCTVVSETISSKNLGRSRPGMPPRPGMPQRPGMAPRGGMPPRPMNRPVPMLPPITSAYKRKYEEEEDEYDPEMDDFIDDGDDEQDEISKHIKEIFGYDRSRYRDESDYALKFMESSWRDLQKEEARSLKLAVQEDLEEERKEQEEMKRKTAKRGKMN